VFRRSSSCLPTPESAQRTLLALASDFRWDRRELIIRPQIAKSRTARIVPVTASMQALQQDRPLRTDDESDTDAFFLPNYSTPVFAWRHSAIGEKTDLLSCILQIAPDSGRAFLAREKMGAARDCHRVAMLPQTFHHYFAGGYLRSGQNTISETIFARSSAARCDCILRILCRCHEGCVQYFIT